MSAALKIDPAKLPAPPFAPTKPVRVLDAADWTAIRYMQAERRRAEAGGQRAPKSTKTVWTAEQSEILKQMWKDGATPDEIGEKLGKCGKTIRRYARNLIKHGELQERPSGRPAGWTLEKLNTLRRLVKEGKSWKEISDTLGHTPEACRVKYGLLKKGKATRQG